jgi:tripartite motif-containing protein 9/67
LEFERLVSAQCESLIQMIQERREFLIDTIRMDKETKLRTLKVKEQLYLSLIKTNYESFGLFLSLKEQQLNCTGKLQQTTGLIQFCIEALKETDSAAFLQVSNFV